MATISELKMMTLTAAVNEMKSPNQFLSKLLFGNHVTVPTEDIEMSIINNGRSIAPFVRKNGEAIMVGGYTSTNQTVAAPNIRIKRPFTPSELLYGRRPGSVIHLPNAQYQLNQIQAHVARDLQVMSDLVTNAQEYLCSQVLQGTISYSVTDEEVFTITYPKPSTHNITLSTFWNGSMTAALFDANIKAVKRLISNAVGLSVTDCILGTEASDALGGLIAGGTLQHLLNSRHITGGEATFVEQFTNDGVLYLGNLCGIRFWEYGRTASLNGTSTDMIRPKYAEFVAATPAAEFTQYYGAIADMKALQGRLFQTERFAKSWEQEDPSVMMALLASRPLPVPRRPGAMVSVKVVSG